MAIITLLLSCAVLLYNHISGDATIIFHSYFFSDLQNMIWLYWCLPIYMYFTCNRAKFMICRL